MKIAIIGSRGVNSFDFSPYIPKSTTEIVSGGAKGVDTLARTYAIDHGIKITEYLPDYAQFHRSAPLIRNKTIIQAADHILAIWDGESRGTLFCIEYAKKVGKPVTVVRI